MTTSYPKELLLSEHFSAAEAIASDTATAKHIDNTMPDVVLITAQKAAFKLEKVRTLLGNVAIHINSWYRSPEVNRAVGGVSNSQHLTGEAIDFVCPAFGSPVDIAKKIMEARALINFDQLIMEHTWVHISFAISNGKPRNQVLSLLGSGGYVAGITDKLGHPL